MTRSILDRPTPLLLVLGHILQVEVFVGKMPYWYSATAKPICSVFRLIDMHCKTCQRWTCRV